MCLEILTITFIEGKTVFLCYTGDMKQKKVIIPVFAFLLSIIILVYILVQRSPTQPTVAFYRVGEQTKAAVFTIIDKKQWTGKKPFRMLELDDTLPLDRQQKTLKKADLLLTYDSPALSRADLHTATLPETALNIMPSAMRRAGISANARYGHAVLLDHAELAWNKAILREAGIEGPATLTELEQAANRLKSRFMWPIVCAGAQDEDLFLLVSALAEAEGGPEGYRTLLDETGDLETLDDLLESPVLTKSLGTLILWREKGYLHPEWLRMTERDVHSFMENRNTTFVFMSLSAHRRVPQRTIERFESSYVPPRTPTTQRSFIAPALLAIRLDRARQYGGIAELHERLTGHSLQRELSAKTGLAPVNASVEANDKQAYDVRLWVAASREPVPMIHQALRGNADTARLAALIRDYLLQAPTGR